MASAVDPISFMLACICREPEAMLPEIATTWLTIAWMLATNRLKLAESWAISSLPCSSSRAVRSPSPSEMLRMRSLMVCRGLTMALLKATAAPAPTATMAAPRRIMTRAVRPDCFWMLAVLRTSMRKYCLPGSAPDTVSGLTSTW